MIFQYQVMCIDERLVAGSEESQDRVEEEQTRPLIMRLLNDFGDFLDEAHIVTAYDVKRGKPNPDPYLMGLQKAGNLKPWEGIVVENAPLGVRAGVAANIFTVAINSGPLPDEELSNKGCNLLYHQMTEFCDDFENLIAKA